MIFVTVGTQDKHFERLLDAIQKQIDNGNIKEEVIVQAGCSKIKSKEMKQFDFLTEDEFKKYIKKCDLLITHGGVGSILAGLEYNKPIIAAARLAKYDEAANDHQEQIIEKFEDAGYLLSLKQFDDLDKVLEKSKTFKPKKYKSTSKEFISKLTNYIEIGKI